MALTLDDIRAAVGRKYASTDIDFGGSDVLVLRNPIRLPKTDRKALMALQEKFEPTEDDDELDGPKEAMKGVLLVAAADKAVAEEFLSLIAEDEGDELPVLTEVFTTYMNEGQVGDA